MVNDNDWRSLPRKGTEKRDKRLACRIPTRHHDYWKKLAESEGLTLSDWAFQELNKLYPPK